MQNIDFIYFNSREIFICFLTAFITSRMEPATKKKHLWDQATMDEAISACQGGMKASVPSRTFGVPRKTLTDRLQGKVNNINCHLGKPTKLTPEIY